MAVEIELGPELVAAFADTTGDYSSIHTNPHFARKTRFREPIVHGMLPLLLILRNVLAGCGVAGTPRLHTVSCRFRDALRIGECVRLEANRSVDEPPTWSLAVRRVRDGSLVMSGTAVVADGARAGASTYECEGLLATPAEENRYTLAELAPGITERLVFRPNPSAFGRVLHLVDAALGREPQATFEDRSTTALMLLSTLIGMRLPGRYATFLDAEVSFPVHFDDDTDTVLEGRVVDILPSGSRMRLEVTWRQNGRLLGIGKASTMIGATPDQAISCAAIRAEHLGFGIEGRVALVTGASRGIGEASAKALAMSGARVAVHYFRGKADAEAIVADIVGNGGQAVAVPADLTDPAAVGAMFDLIEQIFGPVDILVNNAVGDFSAKPVHDLRTADYLAELNVSLFGMHACCTRALPHMRRQRWGKIINMGTIATELPVGSQSKYITAKSAVVGYTRSLAVETAADNIQINLVVPSMTQTSLIAGLPLALIDRLAEEMPGGSLLQPIEVAKVVLFLASDCAAAVSGQQLVVTRGAPPFV
jgi:NAD(P)-dependent dehydrogenase (short-subunit alcohol dehydrogenase family)/acyl dehydratase